MARGKSIRITQNDRQEYARLVRNSKAKINRIRKKFNLDLSNEIELPSIESFSSRKQFNEWKQEISSFTNRNNRNYQFVKNPYDVVASKKEIAEIERATKQAQRIAKKLQEEAKNKPFISGGKEQGTVGQQMLQMGKPNTAGITIPPDFDFNRIRNKEQLKSKKENMEKRSNPEYFDRRMETMKNNFMELLHSAFNSDADYLVEKLKDIPASDFYEMYLMFDEFSFNEYYQMEGIEDDSASLNDLRKMESYVEMYENGRINFDLKNFPSR